MYVLYIVILVCVLLLYMCMYCTLLLYPLTWKNGSAECVLRTRGPPLKIFVDMIRNLRLDSLIPNVIPTIPCDSCLPN